MSIDRERDLARSTQFDFRNIMRAHGVGVRGLDVLRRSDQFEGRFGRLFRTLPAADHDEDDLAKLAHEMVSDEAPKPLPNDDVDPEENSGIAAGYTYFGQFIDHDLTFDPASSLEKTNDPDALVDFRTPRFDLDSVYGRGPDDQPYLYRDDGLHMLLGDAISGNDADANTRDLPRNTPANGDPARALIGDPRNDENQIVSQLQGIFLRFHNALVERETAKLGHAPAFDHVQRLVRWHYQYAIVTDFLPTIVGPETLFKVLPHLKSGKSLLDDPPQLKFFHWRNAPFMPVEFSVAAYRFGHSMVRPFYRLNPNIQLPIFKATGKDDLTGFHKFDSDHAVDWRLFFPIESRPKSGPTRVQPAYKIDTSLVNPLGTLPDPIAKQVKSLAQRNLLRGLRMGLPSGQSVARHMGFEPIPDEKLHVGQATAEKTPTNKLLTGVSGDFAGNAPLWYYILAEAQQQFVNDDTPIHLGDVGGRIVTEVFVGLLIGDRHSYLAQNPAFQPVTGKKFGIADLIQVAQKG